MKPLIYRVLIIEDEPIWYKNMAAALQYFAETADIPIKVDIVMAHDAQTARELIATELFHAVTIDLRLPEKPGGVLTSQPVGLGLACGISRQTPLVWAHIYTAYAAEYALQTYQQVSDAQMVPMPIWQKVISKDAGSLSYTPETWSQEILKVLLPSAAQRNGSSFGQGLDYAIFAGSRHLPPGLAKCCAVMQHWLADKSGFNARFEFDAFTQALFFAETVQHWLCVQAWALLLALGLPGKLVWPNCTKGAANRGGIEAALSKMLKTIDEHDQSGLAKTWLAHLHCGADRMNIIDALQAIRKLRNDFVHQVHDELPWSQLALPMRVVMDAAVFLAAYPVLSRPAPAPDGRWRFSLLQGETLPFPESEWLLAGGVLGESARFEAKRNELSLYQLWPCPDGSNGLLRLWPFAEQRSALPAVKLLQLAAEQAETPKLGRPVWLFAGADKNSERHIWERSALDGKESNREEISQERLAELRSLGAIS